MARRREEEEIVEGEEEDAGPVHGAEFVPEAHVKPKSDIYTMLLILCFLAFLGGSIVAGRELYEHYDVQFWVFEKKAASK